MPFIDRQDAGRQLAKLIERYRGDDTLVLGLARGGVPVAQEVARALDAPLDVMVARKLGAPSNPEFGIGAIAPGGVRFIDERVASMLGISPDELDEITERESSEMHRRLEKYRGVERPPDVRGKTVILVDDGLATGGTARAAGRSLRQQQPRRVVLAVPVCAPDSAEAVRADFDDVVCVEAPEDFRAVGLWYREFGQTSDDEVLAILRGHVPRAPSMPVRVPIGAGTVLQGDLTVPRDARGLVIFAHGSGSSRFSPRNRHVARKLNNIGMATLLLDLLTPQEEEVDERTRELRFDIGLLAERLVVATDWAREQDAIVHLPVGYFGSSTGGGAALVAAAKRPRDVGAVVSRGGRPDLAGDALPDVKAQTLLVVGELDDVVIGLNQDAVRRMSANVKLSIVPRATHLFEEPGALDEVARQAGAWFVEKLARSDRTAEAAAAHKTGRR